ncbi:hypothetical protein TNCV_2858481 [Trichonephila clavipes]|nr:hypothetical protein TNCV_2858481 [Trichonephila clavipes]
MSSPSSMTITRLPIMHHLGSFSGKTAVGRVGLILGFRSCEHHTGDSTIDHPNFEGEHPRGGQGLPTSLSLPAASREDLRFDGYLEYPMPQRHYTFTNTHAASGIRTQALRYSSQHH